jgi:WD40 repeat protein
MWKSSCSLLLIHHQATDGEQTEKNLAGVHSPPPRNDSNEVALYAPPLEDDIYLQQHDKIRTSSLAEPTMKLSGHKGSVYCLAYDPQGEVLCSGSFDSTCLLWKGEF